MSLIINQGKQDTSQDSNFEVMVSPSEVAQIAKLELDKEWENTLNITFKVISEGKFKGRLFWDRISFDPTSKFSWKYRNLRKAAGVPYTESESPNVDIEAMLLNKAVTVELSIRKGTDGNDYQGIKYKTTTATTTAPATPAPTTTDETPAEEDVDVENIELPFDDDVPVTTDGQVDW